MTDEPRLVRNDEKHRYELWLGDERMGKLDYRDEPEALVLVQTRVDPAHEGHGYGSQLVAKVLADARAAGRKLVVECEFAQSYVQRHPEERDLLLSA